MKPVRTGGTPRNDPPQLSIPTRPSEFALYDYQKFHPATQMAELYSSQSKIAPTWTKVTSTPWEGRAVLNGGYGRKMKRTSISNDVPTTFINPELVPPPIIPRMDSLAANVTRISKVRDPEAMSYVLPGGRKDMNSPLYSAPPDKFRAFPCGKLMILEPIMPARRDRSPIKWECSPAVSARQSETFSARVESARLESARSQPALSERSSSNEILRVSSRLPSSQPSARLSNVMLQ